jgi:hypothetical protein
MAVRAQGKETHSEPESSKEEEEDEGEVTPPPPYLLHETLSTFGNIFSRQDAR